MLRVLIVEDHPVFASGLKGLFELESDIEVIGVASSGEAAIELSREEKPDIIILDAMLPDEPGTKVIKQLQEVAPGSQVIVLTGYDDRDLVASMLQAGAKGYLLKDALPSEIIDAVRAVAAGGSRLSPSIARQVIEQYTNLTHRRTAEPEDVLTPREREVLRLTAMGRNNREIAEELQTTERTVQNHLHNIYRKLNLRDRAQAILYGIQHSIVKPPDIGGSSSGGRGSLRAYSSSIETDESSATP